MYYKQTEEGMYYVGDKIIIISNKNNPVEIESGVYKYKFEIDLCVDEELRKVADWCEENCNDEWLVGCSISGFFDECDAMAFKLWWE